MHHTRTMYQDTTASPHRQKGAVLFISLIMLLAMTLIGVTGMQGTIMEEKMAGNSLDINRSFQATEAALREAENFLQGATLPTFDGTTAGLYQPTDAGTAPLWEQNIWTTTGARTYSGSFSNMTLASAPMYIIEELAPVPDPTGSIAADEPLPDAGVYRVTARGTGGSNKSITILQATYKR